MIYNVDIQERAEYDLLRLAKEEPNAFLKAQSLIQELREHPKTGTGHPEPLKGKPEGRWSVVFPKNIDLFIGYWRQR